MSDVPLFHALIFHEGEKKECTKITVKGILFFSLWTAMIWAHICFIILLRVYRCAIQSFAGSVHVVKTEGGEKERGGRRSATS
jgi:hypothetical protein